MRRAAWVGFFVALAGTTGAACSAILGLDPPTPPPDGGPGTGGDGAAPVVCAALDAELGPDASVEAGTYAPLGPVTASGGSFAWFDATQLGATVTSFFGGTFDGQYVYFAGQGVDLLRYDTKATAADAFTNLLPQAWSLFDVKTLGVSGGFSGAVFDGRYVYFVPTTSKVVRYDTHGGADFTSPQWWAWFDVAGADGPVADAGVGFFGGAFDKRYLYLVPHAGPGSVPEGRVVRYDTSVDADAGDPPADAGAADGSTWPAASTGWSAVDLGAENPLAVGFSGAIYDGTSLYLVPTFNDAFGNAIHSGASSTLASLPKVGSFTTASAWTTYDLSNVDGNAYGFEGGAFDGRYVYLVPHADNVVLRYDSSKATINAPSAWSTYDLTRVVQGDPTRSNYGGAAFDGRFVYLLPSAQSSPSFAEVVRYDTLSPFSADCAWTTVDLATAGVVIDGGTDGGRVPGSLGGAVFDGEYLYLIPYDSGIFGRFHVRTPASLPAFGAVPFHGSFW